MTPRYPWDNCQYCAKLTERHIEQLTEAAAFLDGLAEPLRIAEQFTNPATGPLLAPNGAAHELVLKAAAECRAMAKKLRGGA